MLPRAPAPKRIKRIPSIPRPEDGYVPSATVCDILCVREVTLMRWDKDGRIGPRPLRIGHRFVRWKISQITAWIAAGVPDRPEWEELLKQKEAVANG